MSAPYVPIREDFLTSALLAGCARAGFTEAQTIEALSQRVRELEAKQLQAAMMASPAAIIISAPAFFTAIDANTPDLLRELDGLPLEQACAALVAENARLRDELARRPVMTSERSHEIASEEVEAGENFIVVMGETITLQPKQDPKGWAAVFRLALARVIRRSHGTWR